MVTSNSAENSDAKVFFGRFQLDKHRRQLLKDGVEIRIGSRGFDILIALTERAGELVSKRDLLAAVWHGVVVDEAVLRVHVASLRRALGEGQGGAHYIATVSGRGYSFVAPIEPGAGAASSSRVTPTHGHQFPSIPRLFVGRDEVVDDLCARIMQQRFVSVVGAGGIGKTTVAGAIIRQLQSAFGDESAVFVDLGAIGEPSLVAGAVLSAVGCSLGGADALEELLKFVADKRILIVLDSCEHLLDASSRLASQLFQCAPGVCLLVTTREALNVEGEIVHLLSPLACPMDDVPSAADAMATPAVRLFMDRASLAGFEGELSDADAPVVSEICRRTDGIALAIELVASRVGIYGFRGVADLLACDMELSLTGRRHAVPRHRTLQAMLDWSFNLLAESEQRVLAHFSIFVGLFTIEAACAVARSGGPKSNEVEIAIGRLVHKSLLWVQTVGDTVFYRLPDTTRAYAAVKLAELGEFEQVSYRHAFHFGSFFKAIALEQGAYAEIGRHSPHIGNVRKALEWSFSKEDCSIGIELTADSAPLFLGLWLVAECRRWSGLALKAIGRFGQLSHREARLQEAYAVSSLHTQGNTPEVQAAIRRGLELREAGQEALPQLRLLAGLNLFLTRLGDFEGALAAATRCRTVAELNGSLSDRIIAEWMLAAACHLAGDQVAAVKHCKCGFELERSIGRLDINLFGYDHHLRAEIAFARSLWLLGYRKQARKQAFEAIDEASRLAPVANYCMAVVHSIPVLLWSGNTGDIADHVDRAISLAEKHSLRGLAAAARALRGEWLFMSGKPADGVEALRQALRELHREQLHMLIPAASRALADGLARSGRYDEARETIHSAIQSAERMRQAFWMPELLRTQAQIILRGPHPDHKTAELVLQRSMDSARRQCASGWELKAAVPLARSMKSRGRGDEAHALLQQVFEARSETSRSAALRPY